MERNSQLVLAWELGRRTIQHTDVFLEEPDRDTAGRFQLTTDGMSAYPDAIGYDLGTRTDYAVLIKEYGSDASEERRYSAPSIIGVSKPPVHANPDPDRICTSIIERQNLTVRMQMRRFTRLTNGPAPSSHRPNCDLTANAQAIPEKVGRAGGSG